MNLNLKLLIGDQKIIKKRTFSEYFRDLRHSLLKKTSSYVRVLQEELTYFEKGTSNIYLPYARISNNKFIFVNKAFADLFGYASPEELVNLDLDDLFNSPELLFSLKTTDHFQASELTCKNKSGYQFPAEIFSHNFGGDETMLFLRDITKRKIRDIILDLSYDHPVSQEIDIALDLDFNVRFVNTSLTPHIFGYTAEEIIQKSIRNFLTESSYQAMQNVLQEAISTKETKKPEIIVLNLQGLGKNNKEVEIEARLKFLRSQNNEIYGIAGRVYDLTEQHKLTKDLREKEIFLEGIFNTIQDGIFVVDRRGSVKIHNNSMANILGYTPNELRDLNYKKFTVEEDISKLKKAFNKVWLGNAQHYFEQRLEWRMKKKKDLNIPSNYLVSVADFFGLIDDPEKLFKELVTEKYLDFAGQQLVDFEHLPLEKFNLSPEFQHYKNDIYDLLKNHKEIVLVETSIARLNDSNGEGVGFIGSIHETTGRRKIMIELERILNELKESNDALRKSEGLLKLVGENATDIIWLMDLNTFKFDYISPSVFNITGIPVNEVMNNVATSNVTPESLDKLLNALAEYQQALKSGQIERNTIITIEYEAIRKDKTPFPVESSMKLILNEEDNPHKVVAVTRDITERKKLEAKLKKSEAEKSLILKSIQDVVLKFDIDENNNKLLSYISDSTVKVTKYEMTELEKLKFRDLFTKNTLEKILNFLKQRDFTNFNIEAELINKDKEIIPLDVNGYAIFNEQSQAIGYTVVARDITERKKLEEENIKLIKKLREASIYDNMTGLYNRNHFFEMFKNKIYEAIRNNTNLFVLMIDLNNLHELNEWFGHPGADIIIIELANILKNNRQRKVDIVGRIGGDEFMMIFPDVQEFTEFIENKISKILWDLKTVTLEIEEQKTHQMINIDSIKVTVSGYLFKPEIFAKEYPKFNEDTLPADIYKIIDNYLFIAKHIDDQRDDFSRKKTISYFVNPEKPEPWIIKE